MTHQLRGKQLHHVWHIGYIYLLRLNGPFKQKSNQYVISKLLLSHHSISFSTRFFSRCFVVVVVDDEQNKNESCVSYLSYNLHLYTRIKHRAVCLIIVFINDHSNYLKHRHIDPSNDVLSVSWWTCNLCAWPYVFEYYIVYDKSRCYTH